MARNFVTLFTRLRDEHLAKDPGQVPLHMQRSFGCRSTLVGTRNGEYPSLVNGDYAEVPVRFVERGGLPFGAESGVVRYLWREAGSIDVLNVFHLTRETLLQVAVYRMRNRRGIVYLKLDLDVRNFSRWGMVPGRNPALAFAMHRAALMLIGMVDIVSVESDEGAAKLARLYPSLGPKLCVIPNGCDESAIGRYVPRPRDADAKEPLIVTATRPGLPQKNVEMFLDVLGRVDLRGWRVAVLGGFVGDFQQRVDAFRRAHPRLGGVVEFTGQVSDRRVLYDYYDRARLFCLTSRWEGFPLAFVENLRFGNYIITTDVSSARAVTANGTLGSVVPVGDVDAFARELQRQIDRPEISRGMVQSIRLHAESFAWRTTLRVLNDRIEAAIARRRP